MSSVLSADSSIAPAIVPTPRDLQKITIGNDDVIIPSWVHDFDSFRQWMHSADFPERVRIDYLAGEIWVELEMEEILGHNLLKHEIGFKLTGLIRQRDLGEYFPDGARLIHPTTKLACQPDALFASWETMKSGKLQFQPRAKNGFVELSGTPDLVIEIISDSSVRKDDVDNRLAYALAGISEYWLFDVRLGQLRFDLLQLRDQKYAAVSDIDSWKRSELFGCQFRLTATTNRLGMAKYQFEIQ